jgi:hypothetical protein
MAVKVGQIWAIRSRNGRSWANAEVLEVGPDGAHLRYVDFAEFLQAQPGTLERDQSSFRLVKDVQVEK